MPPKKPGAFGRVGRARAGPTAAEKRAQKTAEKEAARAQKERKLRREAELVELPIHPGGDALILHMTQRPNRKRLANAAYDDRSRSKRPRILKNGEVKKVSRLFPWEKDKSLEQPPSPNPGLKVSKDPFKSMGTFGRFPAEIREEIMRYMLVSPKEIAVFRGWTRVYSRRGPRLDLGILYTCRILWLEGIRILFGENTFLYDIRDPHDHLEATEMIMGQVFSHDKIPFQKYGHLLRHIKINVPLNRLNTVNVTNFCNAIRKFVPGQGLAEPARLHTLTLKIPAVKVKDMGFRGQQGDADEIPASRLFTHFTDTRKSLMLLNLQYLRVLATDCESNLYEHVIDLRYYYTHKQIQEDKNKNQVKDAKGAELSFEEKVRIAKSRLYMLKSAIEMLAIVPAEERNDTNFAHWKFLGKEERTRVRDSSDMESLPDDWSDPNEPEPSPNPILSNEYTLERLNRMIADDEDSEIEGN
ncbi:hypothetical protein F5Y11DRAFT_223736 [Daldinia sp. FL1419]|nr:hypothetical protein F5Y11DRAFT_223736 [Daldinia sp. FL1419]